MGLVSKPVEVDEAVETVEAVCCRSSVSSRVSRLTTASCSFSSCIWRSAAVRGRGWRSGPGPGSTPVLSSRGGGAWKVEDVKVGERGGGVEVKRLVDGDATREDRRRD